MAVARLESTPSIPILASIDVNAANIADNSANTIHIYLKPSQLFHLDKRHFAKSSW
jgi:hypothetical protein